MPSGVTRTPGWHQVTFIDTPQTLTIQLDGAAVYSRSGGTPFDHATISLSGPYWRPAFTTYFDELTYVPYVQPTTVVTPGTASITVGQSATFTAAVSSSTGTPSDGTVQFFVNGSAYGSAVAVNSGQAEESITEDTAGNYAVTAQYLGDSTTYAASPVSAAATLNVSQATSTGFSDGFEGPSLNPFWSTSDPNSSGTISLTSEIAHTGSGSVQFENSSSSDEELPLLVASVPL